MHQVIKLEHKAHVQPAVLGEPAVVHVCDDPVPDRNPAGAGPVHAPKQVQHGGFACAAVPQDDAQLALFDAEGDMIRRVHDGIAGGIILADILKCNIAHSILSGIL